MSRTFTLADTREGMIVLLSHAVRRYLLRDTTDWHHNHSKRSFNVCGALADAHACLLQHCADSITAGHLDTSYHELYNKINHRLGKHAYVNDWLRAKVSGKGWVMNDAFGPSQPEIIAYRRAWVHDMIRTLKAGGDL